MLNSRYRYRTSLTANPDSTMKNLRGIGLILLFNLCFLPAAAQVKGKVVDRANHRPVEFAKVLIEGTSVGVVANAEGEFELFIPENRRGKNIIISRIGYKTDTLYAPSPDQNVLVTLAQQPVELAEVIVKPLDPLDILKQAVRKIPENYPAEPVYLYAYYREMVETNGIFVKYADAACQLYSCAYTTPFDERKASSAYFKFDFLHWDKNKPFPQAKNTVPHQDDAVQVLAVRKSNDLEKFTNRWDFEENLKKFDISGGPLHVTAADLVKLRKDVVDPSTWEYYLFKLEAVMKDGKKNTYKISFKPKKNRENALWEGVVYIDEESSAFMEFEYAVSEKGKKFLREKHYEQTVDLNPKMKRQLNRASVKRVVEQTGQNVQVSYSRLHNKWYLSYIRIVNEFENSGDVFEKIIYHTYLDLYINDIQNRQVHRFPEENRFPTGYFSYLYHYPFPYDPGFWKKYNTPVPTELYKKAVKDLEKNKPLQEQFQKN